MSDLLESVIDTPEYMAIERFYGSNTTARSKVPLMNHIRQGVRIIEALDGKLPNGTAFAPKAAACGYCLHPLLQNDRELLTVGMLELTRGEDYDFRSLHVALAMEYRWRANNWLSDKVTLSEGSTVINSRPNAGSVAEVRAMLIADKVQNYKDYLVHHAQTHAKREQLSVYFPVWLRHLDINHAHFTRLADAAGS